MFDWLLRRGNPTNKWNRKQSLVLTLELRHPMINSVAIGASIRELSFLGRSSSNEITPLDYADLGISIDYEIDDTFSGFQIILDDTEPEISSFAGTLTYDGVAVDPFAAQNHFGEPYWVDRDENESILFFEFPEHEIQIEQSLNGRNLRFIVTRDPLMADIGNREAYGVDKPWPPAAFSKRTV